MREDLLHYIWKFKKIPFTPLVTQQQEELRIIDFGFLNSNEGPDFLNARLTIDGQQWAGNVEMHLKSSDWYAHHHETDSNYDNVILHVVWEDDLAVFRKDGSQISTLELKDLISEELLLTYKKLMDTSKVVFVNCEKNIRFLPKIHWKNWEERLYFERLEQKSKQIEAFLEKTKNNWEAVLFVLLCKSFGTKTNGAFFLDRALKLNFSILRKASEDLHQLESLLFGHFGLLGIENCSDRYFIELEKEYNYLKQKFDLSLPEKKPAFFGIRPANFPTLRISQLAHLYHKNSQLFHKLMMIKDLEGLYTLFEVYANPYWDNHFTFGKVSKTRRKKLSKHFIDLLLINTLIPLKFCYGRYLGRTWDEDIMELISKIKGETNSIVEGFHNLDLPSANALESQAKIQLYKNYCSQKKCLQCSVGVHLLNRNVYF